YVSFKPPCCACYGASAPVVHEGCYELLLISATVLPPSSAMLTTLSNNDFLAKFVISIQAGPGGQILGGVVEGPLITSRTVYIVAASFNNPCGTKIRRKRMWIKDLCFKHNIHFLGVQESKMIRLELYRLKYMWGNYSFDYACSLARGRSGGLISTWDPNFFVKEDIWCNDAFIIVKGRWKNTDEDYFMINIYGPHDLIAKNSLWNRSREFTQLHRGKYLLFGDLNEVRFEYERLDSSFSHSEVDLFNSFIKIFGLIELPMGGRLFTWMIKAGTKLSKLDRFLFSENIIEEILDLCFTALDRLWSDHNRILLHCNKNSDNKKLLSNEKLKCLKAAIKQWHGHTVINDRLHKHEVLPALKDIEAKIEVGTASSEDHESRINLLQQIDNLDKIETLDLFQKSHIKWYIEGGENSKFIHDPLQAKETFLKFFKEKFQPHVSTIDFLVILTSSSLSPLDRDSIEKNVSLDEIKNAV
nr:RNA-directed DNA polymerase, eukaryota, reverse transcriptase zinc-binding domain protein [Tanacetum cinerariifolium]